MLVYLDQNIIWEEEENPFSLPTLDDVTPEVF